MRFAKGLIALSAFVLLQAATANGAKLEFAKSPVTLTPSMGQPFSYDLVSFLKATGTGGVLTWGIRPTPAPPTWVSIPAGTSTLKGAPPAGVTGSFSFVVAVVEMGPGGVPIDGGTSAEFVLNVVSTPNWNVSSVDLGKTLEGNAFTPVDLSKFAVDPSGKPLTFKLEDPSSRFPNWLTLSPKGVITATRVPTRADVGVFNGFSFVATTTSGGSSTVTASGEVVKVFKGPKWVSNPLAISNATEDANYSQSVSGPSFVLYTESESLKFEIFDGINKNWISMTDAGLLQGIPTRANGGLVTLQARVSANYLGVVYKDETTLKFNVNLVNKPPAWSKNPIILPDAYKRTSYGPQDLRSFATDPDPGAALTYSLVSWSGPGSAWATLSAGQLSGIPQTASLGLHEWTVQVSDGEFQVTTKVQVTVRNRPPLCQSPAVLADAFQDADYRFDLRSLAQDPDSDPLTFASVALPTWMKATPDGQLSGKPVEANIGSYSTEFTVADPDGADCRLVVTGKVLRSNWPPVVHTPISFTVKERQTFSVNLNAPQYVEDKDGANTLTFAALAWPPWATLSTTGDLVLAPQFSQISPPVHSLSFTVSDGKATTPGTIQVTVVRDPRPPKWRQDPILFSVVAGNPFSQTLADKVLDLDGLPVTFRQDSGPASAWLTLSASGQMTGLPTEAEVGDNVYKVTAANDGASAQVTVIVRVKSANHSPRWTKKPLLLPDAFVAEAYPPQSIASFATDEDPGDRLSFELLGTASWAFVTTSGLVIGSPALVDVGLTSLVVRVKDSFGAFDDVEVQINVRQRPQRPRWTKAPIDLGTAYAGDRFSFDLVPYVVNPSGKVLSFRKSKVAPAWLSVLATGQVAGTPAITDLGAYTTAFEVSDDSVVWVGVDAFGKVAKRLVPPKLNLSALVFTVRAGDVLEVDLNQPKYVNNPDSDPLKFELLRTESWISVDAAGKLVLKPQVAQIGEHSFPLKITGGSGATDEGPVQVKVLKALAPVTWLENPIRYTTFVNQKFSANLAAKVSNPDGVALSFAKLNGAAWLALDANGALSGVSTKVGEEQFSVSVTPEGRPAVLATVIISTLEVPPTEDGIRIDDPVPGARIDNLWVVDNSPNPCSGESCLIQDLRQSIDEYYAELDRAGVHHYGIYLSSDACLYRKPIKDSRGKVLLSWDDRSWVRSFNDRIDNSPGDTSMSSPMIATWSFLYSQVTSVSSPYFEANVPMEGIFISPSGDQYRNYGWSEISGWGPAKYAQYYLDEHAKAKKPLRISALAVAGSPSYQASVNASGGKYYAYTGSSSVERGIKDFAQQVIFRAFVAAKKRVKLSKVPTDSSSIKVSLAGVPLAANQWRYDATTNEIEVYWYLIDQTKLKAGDRLTIVYR